jgi:hypothetical protein
MTLRYSILFLLLPTLVSACSDSTQKKKYSVTTYFTSFDSSGNSMGNHGKKFKYSYEEYNVDSNLIYQELYATPDNFGDMWGKLLEKTKFYYNGKEKVKAEIEYGISYPASELGRGKGKKTDTYEYKDGLLSKWLSDGKLVEDYQYDVAKNLIQKRVTNFDNVPEYYRFTYRNGLRTKSEYFVADTIWHVDTFLYDKNNKQIEKISVNGRGERIDRRVIIRNYKGQAIEEKWRKPFTGWLTKNGEIVYDDFYQTNKYYYDNIGRPAKTEFYELGKLQIVYEFTYD